MKKSLLLILLLLPLLFAAGCGLRAISGLAQAKGDYERARLAQAGGRPDEALFAYGEVTRALDPVLADRPELAQARILRGVAALQQAYLLNEGDERRQLLRQAAADLVRAARETGTDDEPWVEIAAKAALGDYFRTRADLVHQELEDAPDPDEAYRRGTSDFKAAAEFYRHGVQRARLRKETDWTYLAGERLVASRVAHAELCHRYAGLIHARDRHAAQEALLAAEDELRQALVEAEDFLAGHPTGAPLYAAAAVAHFHLEQHPAAAQRARMALEIGPAPGQGDLCRGIIAACRAIGGERLLIDDLEYVEDWQAAPDTDFTAAAGVATLIKRRGAAEARASKVVPDVAWRDFAWLVVGRRAAARHWRIELRVGDRRAVFAAEAAIPFGSLALFPLGEAGLARPGETVSLEVTLAAPGQAQVRHAVTFDYLALATARGFPDLAPPAPTPAETD